MFRYRTFVLATVVLAAFSPLACTTGDSTAESEDASGDTSARAERGRREVLAPIEATELLVRESSPPQYAVRITSGLPSGCATFERIDIERDGTIVGVSVWNTVPSDENVACTMIYGTTQNVAELGNAFESGQTYDVRVNGETGLTFTAQ